MNEALRKKYIPMTETIYYTLLSVMTPRHGYAVIQYVSGLTGGRLLLGTGTLYTMVGRLTADGIIETVPDDSRKAYRITDVGLELLQEETERLQLQLADGRSVLEKRCAADRKAAPSGERTLDGEAAPSGERTLDGEAALSGERTLDGEAALSGERTMNGKAALSGEHALDGKASPNGEYTVDGKLILNRAIALMGTGAMAEKQNLEYRGGYIGDIEKALRFLHIAPDLSQSAAGDASGISL